MHLSGRPLLDNAADQRLFVGRAQQIDRIERSLGAGLNCLLTGVAGSGKTSLVRAVMFRAHRAGRREPRYYVRGGAARTAAQLLAEVVGVVRGGARSAAAATDGDPLTLLDELAEVLEVDALDGLDPDADRDDVLGQPTRPPGPPVLVIDDVTAAAGAQLFGALRDEVWQLGALWLVTTTPAQALDLVRPPADVFFETRVTLDALDGPEVADLLRRRLDPGSAAASGEPSIDPAELVDAVLAGRPDTPRRALEAAREWVTNPGVGPSGLTVAQEHRARAEALENVSRPARMLAQELEAIGWAAASDERLLDRLGWTRTRVIQVLGELRDEGLVQMREERRGRGRPRKLFRVMPAAEFTPRSDPAVDTLDTLDTLDTVDTADDVAGTAAALGPAAAPPAVRR